MASESVIPVGSGAASGSASFAFQRLFDSAPALSPANGIPVANSGGQAMPATSNRHGYIDFGPDFAKIRISSIWTLYSAGPPSENAGFEGMWWSNDASVSSLPGAVVENGLPIGTSLLPSALSSPQWTLEWNGTGNASPMVPLRRFLIFKTGSMVSERMLELCFIGSLSEAKIIAPHAAGTAGGSDWMDLSRAFDGTVTWNSQGGYPEGLLAGESVPSFGGRIGFIDFGPNWNRIAITETWILFNAWGSGLQLGFDQVWWDDETDSVNDSGLVETRLSMNCENLVSNDQARWVRNHDFRSSPVLPKARYLIMKGASGMSNRALEYMLYGYVQEVDDPQDPGNVDPIDLLSPPENTPVLTLPQPQVFNPADLELIEEIHCGEPPNASIYKEFRSADIEVRQILGRNARVLKNTASDTNYFAYKMGVGKNLEHGAAYLLMVDYPDDVDRTFVIINTGDETRLGFATGKASGDSVQPRYVSMINESLNYGFTGTYQTWHQFFHLHDRVVEFGIPRDSNTQSPWESQRTEPATNGFWVTFVQQPQYQGPKGQGMAVARVALYKVKNPRSYDQPLSLPQGLPQRHMFWREEMSDGAVGHSDPTLYGCVDDVDWYKNRARRLKFLGMNTFATDMLEFGHVQGWDSSKYPNWYTASRFPDRWTRTLTMLNREFPDLNVLPYYEYSGGTASNENPELQGLGRKRRARPLFKEPDPSATWPTDLYTFIGWTEERNIDVTDPDALAEFKRVLECTIVDQRAGAAPIPLPITAPAPTTVSGTGTGYIDLGTNWANLRIRGTWTRSRKWSGGPATPYSAVFWHSNWQDFQNQATPAAAISETTLNFVTEDQNRENSVWTQDTTLQPAQEITPKGRYLILRTGASFTNVTQFLITGRLSSEPSGTLRALPVSSAGSVDGHPFLHNLANAFDEDTELDAARNLNFLGAWIRPRISDFPISFADATRARYAASKGISVPSKDDLKTNSALYNDYFSWWRDQRKAFLTAVRDYLRQHLGNDALVLYTWDYSEPGVVHPNKPVRMISEEPEYWQDKLPGTNSVSYTFRRAVEENLHFEAMERERSNVEGAEWGHTHPRGDPLNYKNTPNVYMTYVMNKLYSVAKPEWMEAYQNGTGLAVIRHFSLNENNTNDHTNAWDGMGNRIAGYYVANMEAHGPYSMLAEARALALGNPYYLGYLSSNIFNRGFPGYARAFNANFLALPALPMDTVEGYTSDPHIIMRRIITPSNGIWIAAINIGFHDELAARITFPYSGGTIKTAVGGQTVTVDDSNSISLDMYPGQLVTWHITGNPVPWFPDAAQTFSYSETSTEITLTGINGTVAALEIPGTINGKPVRRIEAQAFTGRSDIISVSIPSSVREIGAHAFSNCPNLAMLILAEGVQSIEEQAFAWVPNLTHLYLPASLTSLDPTAFVGCQRLAQVAVSPSNPSFSANSGVLYSKDGGTLTLYPSAISNLSFTVPSAVTSIGPWAFAGAENLESVILPAGLETIQTGAFFGCAKLDVVSPPAQP